MITCQYAVLVTDLELGGTVAYGPYRSQARADEVAVLLTSSQAADHGNPEKFSVRVASLEHYRG